MSTSKRFTIGMRIAITSGFLCLVIAGLGTFAIHRLRLINAISEKVSRKTLPGLIDVAVLNASQAESQIRVLRILLAKTPEQRAAYKEEIKEQAKKIDDALESYSTTIVSDEDRHNFDQMLARRDDFRKVRQTFFETVETDPQAAQELASTQLRHAYANYSAAADALFNYNVKSGREHGARLEQEARFAQRLLIGACLTALVLGVAASLLSIRTIRRALVRIAGALDDGALQVAAAAGQVSSSSQTLAEGSSEQAASLEETSASLEEMSSMTKRNAESSAKARELSGQTREAADAGAADMAEMRNAMDAIQRSSGEIAKIVKTIDEIAFQTNILALNAAVEAARAGDAGAGFAVVAEEVRALAQRSAEAAKETAGKIEDSVSKSEHGVTISGKVAESLRQIVERARKMDELVVQIATASHEQTQGIGQVGTAVSQMDKVTQSNASNAEETAAAAEELNAQAGLQRQAVEELLRLVGADQTHAAGLPGAGGKTSTASEPLRASSPRARSVARSTPKPAESPFFGA